MDNPHNINRPDLVNVLESFGKKISNQYEKYLTSIVTVTRSERILIDFTLYIIAVEISFEYRVINVEVLNYDKLKLRFYALVTNQSEHFEVDISKNSNDFLLVLNKIEASTLFQAEINHLINQVNLKRDYSKNIKDKIVAGQAGVAVLKNGDRINVGWIKIDENDVIYYTGKGLREIWKPNMIEEERIIAEKLKLKSSQELILSGHIEKRSISEFEDVE